jgi:hypothetical protein
MNVLNTENEMMLATIAWAKTLMTMNDGELDIAMEMSHDDMIEAVKAEKDARDWRGLCGVRVTMTQHEQIRRALASNNTKR